MGVAELSGILSVVCALFIALLIFVGKGALEKLERHETRLAEQKEAIAVMSATKLGERVQKLEDAMGEIKGDLRYVRSWVENQEGRPHHRRSGDQPGKD